MNNNKYRLLLLAGIALIICASVQLFLVFSSPVTPVAKRPAAKNVPMQRFMEAVRSEQVTGGRILYMGKEANFAAVTATFTIKEVTPPKLVVRVGDEPVDLEAPSTKRVTQRWNTYGKLSDIDLFALQNKGFMEDVMPPTKEETGINWTEILLWILIGTILLSMLMGIASRFRGVGKQKTASSTVKFASVAGCTEAKEEVQDVVEFLKNPKKFTAQGGRMVKGLLLIGPPGTGKTLLAKAVAGEANVPFYNLSGSDFVEMFVGLGASRIRSIFAQARKTAKKRGGCLIFIDEIDAVGKKRGVVSSSGQDERDQTLNALLVEMDGFGTGEGVIIMAATNHPESLDNALLRPGRFDRKVYVQLPDLPGRKEILLVHAKKLKLDAEVKLDDLAAVTSGASGAVLESILNEAALLAARREHSAVMVADINDARDKVLWGRERRLAMSQRDKKLVAAHEAGHALMQVLNQTPGETLHKVTILPRGDSLGSTHFGNDKDEYNQSQEKLLAELRVLAAGRIAEDILEGYITCGASGDIKQATKIAKAMAFKLGMTPLGFFAIEEDSTTSEKLRQEADKFAIGIIKEQFTQAKTMLTSHKEMLRKLADELLAKETMTGEEVRALCQSAPVTETLLA